MSVEPVLASPFVIEANLDQEARWSGLALPAHVRRRVAAASTLLAALAPERAEVEIFALAAVDPARVQLPGKVSVYEGPPPRAPDLRWSDPAARTVNDRRFALAVTRELGVAPAAACTIESVDELATVTWPARWVAKAAWTAAGRDRARGDGVPVGELRARIENLVSRAGALVLEPWCDRLLDFGVCGTTEDPPPPPHTLLVDERGGFAGIDLAEPALLPAERADLARVVATVQAALTRAGYRGPFGVDGFVYRDDSGERRLRACCEINARFTFGHVARALGTRLGTRALGFGPMRAGARVLVAASDDDPFTAWVA